MGKGATTRLLASTSVPTSKPSDQGTFGADFRSLREGGTPAVAGQSVWLGTFAMLAPSLILDQACPQVHGTSDTIAGSRYRGRVVWRCIGTARLRRHSQKAVLFFKAAHTVGCRTDIGWLRAHHRWCGHAVDSLDQDTTPTSPILHRNLFRQASFNPQHRLQHARGGVWMNLGAS